MTENELETLTYRDVYRKPVLKTSEPEAAGAPIPGVEFLGRGYNIIHFDPLNPGAPDGISQIPVFELKVNSPTQDGRFLIPDGSTYTPDPRLSFEAQSTQLETAFDLNQKFSASVKASGGYGPVSFSASGSYDEFGKLTESTASIVMLASFNVLVWIVSWQQPALSEAFKQAVSQLPITYDEAAYFKFIDTFGTHYPQRITYGGLGYQSYTFTRKSRTQLDTEKVNISVAAEVGLALSASVGGETTRERQEFESLSEVSSASSLLYVGGSNQASFETFVASIVQNPIPVQLTLLELTDLLTANNFPDTAISTIKNNLTQANEAYAEQIGQGYVRYAASPQATTNVYDISGVQGEEIFLSVMGGSNGVWGVPSSFISEVTPIWHLVSDLKAGGDIVKTGEVLNITLNEPGVFTFLGARGILPTPDTPTLYNASPTGPTRNWRILDPLDPTNVGQPVFIGKEYVLHNVAINKCVGFYFFMMNQAAIPVADTATDIRARCRFI